MPTVVKPKDNKSPVIRVVLLGTIAFTLGAILTWTILSQIPRPAASVPSREIDLLPDVSAQTPSQGAVTLGNWYFDHHEWAKAAEQYRKAINLGLDNADVHSDLGSALRFDNQPESAAAEYEIAQRENSGHENSLFNLATLYLQSLNRPERAIELLEEFKTRFPLSGAIPRVDELLQEARRRSAAGPTPNAG
jgi:tetratricopeptide (TPR) repeat protein